MSNKLTVPAKPLSEMTAKDLATFKKAEQARIEKAKQAMKPELLEITNQVAETLDKMAESVFRKSWTIGKVLAKVVDNEEKFGKDPLDQMAVVLSRSSSFLYKSERFYRAFDEDDLNKLLDLKMKSSGERLSWLHVEVAMKEADKEARMSLLEQAAEHDWTSDEMDHSYRLLEHKPTAKHAGGRPVKVNQTITAKLESLDNVAGAFLKKNTELWSHEKHGFIAAIEEMPADKITDNFLAKLDEAVDSVDKLIEEAPALREDLQKARELAHERLEAQGSTNGELVDDDEGEKKSKKAKKIEATVS